MKTSQYEKGDSGSLIVATAYRGLFGSKGYVFLSPFVLGLMPLLRFKIRQGKTIFGSEIYSGLDNIQSEFSWSLHSQNTVLRHFSGMRMHLATSNGKCLHLRGT